MSHHHHSPADATVANDDGSISYAHVDHDVVAEIATSPAAPTHQPVGNVDIFSPKIASTPNADGLDAQTHTTPPAAAVASPPPLWAWFVLAVAVCAMSSGGIWFALLPDTPPFLRASWRLILTSLLQLPAFARAMWKADAPLRARWAHSNGLMCITGVVLAVHFGAWSYSVATTSLTHSLLFVSTTPLILIVWTIALAAGSRCAIAAFSHAHAASSNGSHRRSATPSRRGLVINLSPETNTPRSPSVASADCSGNETYVGTPATDDDDELTMNRGRLHRALSAWGFLDSARHRFPTLTETAGTVLGMIAAVLLALEAGRIVDDSPSGESTGAASSLDHGPSLVGDAAAVCGAIAMGFYLHVGSTVQKRMPLWLYVFPVTFIAGVSAGAASLAFEPAASAAGTGAASLFGWCGTPARFGYTLGAALGAGILGHTGANAALGAGVNPLVVSVVLLFEPIMGSIGGAIVGVQEWPSAVSAGAGLLLILGAALVTLGVREGGLRVDWPRLSAVCRRGSPLE